MGKLRLVKSATVSKSPSLLTPLYERAVDAREIEIDSSIHKEVRTFSCVFCDQEFKRKIAKHNHEKKHKKEIKRLKQKETLRKKQEITQIFSCPECDMEFNQQRLLTIHKKVHSKMFRCIHCDELFKDRMDLDWHGAISDGLKHESLNAPVHRTRSQSRLSCQRTFTTRAMSCDENIFRRGENDAQSLTSGKGGKRRPGSTMSMVTTLGDSKKRKDISYWLNNNKYMTDSDYDDTYSEISFKSGKTSSRSRASTPAISWTSMMSYSSRFSKFYCSVNNCMKTFQSMAWLTTHEISEHKMLALFKCKECRKRFTLVENLKQHMIENHPIAITCLLCDQPLRSVFDFTEHYQLHQKYTYNCKLCGKMFLSVYFLEEHMRNKRFHKIPDKPKMNTLIRIDRNKGREILNVDFDEVKIVQGFSEIKYSSMEPQYIPSVFMSDFTESLPWRTL